jgi:hypothetical protein
LVAGSNPAPGTSRNVFNPNSPSPSIRIVHCDVVSAIGARPPSGAAIIHQSKACGGVHSVFPPHDSGTRKFFSLNADRRGRRSQQYIAPRNDSARAYNI